MERLYHRFENWECYKSGFFKNVSGEDKKEKILKVIELFSNENLTELYMNKVIENWINSCEHNLTNLGLNRVAWIGQSACCLYANIPYKITMESWRLVDEKHRIKACEVAEKIIKKYEQNFNKRQLCLKFI